MSARPSLEVLTSHIQGIPSLRSVLDTCDELGALGSRAWRNILLDLPLDGPTFAARFECSWDEQIDNVQGWLDRFQRLDPSERTPEREQVFGYLALLFITLVSLRYSEQYRSGR